MPITPTNPFKGRHFPGEVILLCVRWYLRYPLASAQARLDLRNKTVISDRPIANGRMPYHDISLHGIIILCLAAADRAVKFSNRQFNGAVRSDRSEVRSAVKKHRNAGGRYSIFDSLEE